MSPKYFKKNLFFLSGSATAIFLLLLVSGVFNQETQTVKANSPHNLSGYAWSDNIGWLSFNCSDLGTCASVDYGVDINGSGILSGYAWSDNIGWVSFNSSDLTGCPSGTCNARLNSATGVLSGWVKALSADGNGWDGWVSLSGASPAYGPTLNTTDPNNQIFEGYAWGDEVVGWLKFDPWTGYAAKLSQPVCNTNASCEAGLGENTTTCPSDCIIASFDLAKTGDLSITFVSSGQQASNSTTLSVSPSGGMENPITLTLDSVKKPDGQTVTPASLGISPIFSQDVLNYVSGSYQTSMFKVRVSAPLTSGNYTLTVLGSGGGIQRTINIGLSVNSFLPGYEEF